MNPTNWLTGALVIITAYYAWQTHKTAATMQESNELQNRPVVSINLRTRHESISFLDFVVINSGRGLARDISFKVTGKNFVIKEMGNKKEKLKDFRVIKHGIKNLAPGEKRGYWFMSVIGRVEEVQSANTKIEVEYSNATRTNKYVDSFDLDFLSLPEYQLGHDPQYKTIEALESIESTLDEMTKYIYEISKK